MYKRAFFSLKDLTTSSLHLQCWKNENKQKKKKKIIEKKLRFNNLDMVTFQIFDLEQIIIKTKKEIDLKCTNQIKLNTKYQMGKTNFD